MSETPFVALCLETLSGGAVQSFIDIMYLAAEGSLTFKELADVRSSLVDAESGRRMGDAPAVMSAFASLIQRFKTQGKLRIAVFFMERLLEIAKLTGDAVSEMHAHQDLGEALELLGEDDAALLHHHAHRAIATALDDSDGKSLACTHLVRVYLRQGRKLDSKREHAKSLELYLAAADAAESTGDDLAQAETAFAAGRAYIMTGQPESAVPVLQTYLRLVLACDSLAEREMEAYASLASAQLAAGNLDGAAECLDEIVHTEDVDARLLAEAHEQLGVIKARKGDAANAERFLEAAFKGWEELQPTEFADRKRLDKVCACCEATAAVCILLCGDSHADLHVSSVFRRLRFPPRPRLCLSRLPTILLLLLLPCSCA